MVPGWYPDESGRYKCDDLRPTRLVLQEGLGELSFGEAAFIRQPP